MLVSDVLRSKGDWVAHIAPEASVTDAVSELRTHGVGALVVSNDGSTIEGLISEAIVVALLANHGSDALGKTVSDVMITEVLTCESGDSCDLLMRTMTKQRVRHLPVVENERIVGIISIGDVVKARLDELERERQALSDYITTGR